MVEHRVFIDANVLLSFYEISKEDIQKLIEAFKLVDHKEMVFVTTECTREEFIRRRSGVIEKSLEDFGNIRLPVVPTMGKYLATNPVYVEARKTITNAHKKLLEEISNHAKEKSLEADALIEQFFNVAREIKAEKAIIDRARDRVDIGNPPGKRGSFGDAFNWECLLSLKADRSLSIVSDDIDYRDRLKKDEIADFLMMEWDKTHTGSITLYRSLSTFLEKSFPEVTISSLDAVDDKINDLMCSNSFAQTHACITELSAVSNFTAKQASELVAALDANNQVGWIISDSDVNDFYKRLLKDFGSKLDELERDYLEQMVVHDGTTHPPKLVVF